MASTPTTPNAGSSSTPMKPSDFAEVARLAREAAGVSIVTIDGPADASGVPGSIPVGIKHGQMPELVDVSKFFESWRTIPRDRRGAAKALTLKSFIDLVNYHALEHSAVFADTNWQSPSFTAVIDYHEPSDGAPGFGRHRVVYQFPLSVEWTAWRKQDGERMSQGDFAAFLEDHIADLASPTAAEVAQLERDFQTKIATPAELMQLSRGLQVNVDSRVKTLTTLQSGEGHISWEETHRDGEGKPLKVPGLFMLSISPFFMGEPIRVPVRLRYRASGGSIAWSMQIWRADQFVTERVRSDLDLVHQQTNLLVYEGSPEMLGSP